MTAAARKLAEGIRFELRRFPRKDVDQFVRSVGAALGAYDIWRQYDRKSRHAALVDLDKATRAYLKAMETPVVVYFPDRMDAGMRVASNPDTAEMEAFYRAKAKALEAAQSFQRRVAAALVKSPPPARSRPPADAVGLLARVAQKYLEILGTKPATTPNGTFSNIAILLLENAHGTAPKDVARQVRAAIKTL